MNETKDKNIDRREELEDNRNDLPTGGGGTPHNKSDTGDYGRYREGNAFGIVVAIIVIGLVAGLTAVGYQYNLYVGIGATVVSGFVAYYMINRIPKKNV